MTHAKLGASSANRWMNCPGSIQFIAMQPEFFLDNSSEYADEGTKAHAIAEALLNKNLTLLSELEGHEIIEVEPEVDLQEAVETYTSYINNSLGPVDILHIEQKFFINEEFFGTNDACIEKIAENTLNVLDYKHGVGVPVEATDNKQLKYYAIGAMTEFGTNYDKVTLTIVQPRSFHPDGPVRSWDTTPRKLLEFKDELFEAGEATKKKNAPLVAGNHCRFCPALAVCPAYKTMVMKAANAPGLADNLLLSEVLPKWKASVRRVAFNAMTKGVKLPGWKLVEGRTNRKWVDKDKVVEALREAGKTDEEIFKSMEPQLNNLGTIEKMMGKNWVKDYVFKPVGALTVAPESDKRPEFSKADQDFADIEIEV